MHGPDRWQQTSRGGFAEIGWKLEIDPETDTWAAEWDVTCHQSLGGGLVFGPVHNIQAHVSPENVVAFCEAAYEYGG